MVRSAIPFRLAATCFLLGMASFDTVLASSFSGQAALAEDQDIEGSAVSLLQGAAKKIRKKRTRSAQPSALQAAVTAMDDFDDGAAVSLMQGSSARVKKSSKSCTNSLTAQTSDSWASGVDAALFAASLDGVEDGMAALNLLQNSGEKIAADECSNDL